MIMSFVFWDADSTNCFALFLCLTCGRGRFKMSVIINVVIEVSVALMELLPGWCVKNPSCLDAHSDMLACEL